jgi:hypothetical protein
MEEVSGPQSKCGKSDCYAFTECIRHCHSGPGGSTDEKLTRQSERQFVTGNTMKTLADPIDAIIS